MLNTPIVVIYNYVSVTHIVINIINTFIDSDTTTKQYLSENMNNYIKPQ